LIDWSLELKKPAFWLDYLRQRNRVFSVRRKKPGFFCWGKETGFLLWISRVICGSEKETRFLSFWGFLGVSVVGAKKPGFCCWGKETGFLLWISRVICGMRKRNPVSRFLGFSGFLLLGQRNRVSSVDIISYLWEPKKKPGFWGRLTNMSDSSE
jgi:hypothetical protein